VATISPKIIKKSEINGKRPLTRPSYHQLSGCRFFSKIDLVRAYNQISVHPNDTQKTAITPFGLFEFPFMSFGLRNATQTFQRFMDNILRGLEFCFAYIDDILIFFTHTRGARTPSADTFRPTSDLRHPDQPGEVRIQSIRGHLPRLQSFRRGFPTA
jgi:hypothetical protein